MSLPLLTRADVVGEPARSILKVVDLEEFLRSKYEPEDCALWFDDSPELIDSRAASDVPWGAIVAPSLKAVPELRKSRCVLSAIKNPAVVDRGDVIQVSLRQNLVSVLHRRRSRTNSLLVTERCNSYCVMCSQPPIEREERTDHLNRLLNIVRLIDTTESVLGITGGEPTLLGADLARLIAGCRAALPKTELHVLTNGRTFADPAFCNSCAEVADARVTWAVPLYTDAPEIHDYVVQRKGAFIETMSGFMNLAREKQRIEIRIVLQRATVPRLKQFADFIARNMPFVEHVAWMGLEPMGFARPNWTAIWMDPSEYAGGLQEALETLDTAGVRTSIYNLPLCVLSPALRRYAARSISDWKNTFAEECTDCAAKSECCGFFVSAKEGFKPGRIDPIKFLPEVSDSLFGRRH